MSYSLSFTQSLYIMLFVASKIEEKMFEFISTQQIADKLSIPPSTSSVILRRLKKAGLIEAREGVNGGVRLAKPPEEITVFDIFDAVEQSASMFQTNVNIVVAADKAPRVQQLIQTVLEKSENQMKDSLRSVTIRDMLNAFKG